MGGFGAFLAALAPSLARRVLASLGFGVVTFVGLSTVLGSLLDQARSAWGGMGGDIAAMMALAGFNTAISIIAGALVARLALVQLKRLVPV